MRCFRISLGLISKTQKFSFNFSKNFARALSKKGNGKFFGFGLRWKRRRKQELKKRFEIGMLPLPQPTPARATLYSLGFYSRYLILRYFGIVIIYKQQFAPKLRGQFPRGMAIKPMLCRDGFPSCYQQHWLSLERVIGS